MNLFIRIFAKEDYLCLNTFTLQKSRKTKQPLWIWNLSSFTEVRSSLLLAMKSDWPATIVAKMRINKFIVLFNQI